MLRTLLNVARQTTQRSVLDFEKRWYQKRKMREVPIWIGDIVEVEFCTEQDYYEHYRILKEKLMIEFADLLEVRGNPYGMPRNSSFEVLWRRGDELQEELWSKYASNEPQNEDAMYGVTEVIVYDLQQIFKKYGTHRGRYITRFPSTIEEMDYYRDLADENESILKTRRRRWPDHSRTVTLETTRHRKGE